MVLESGGVSLVRIVTAPIALLLCILAGCALQRDQAGAVSDNNFEWVRVGFSVKAPAGSNWYRLPSSDKNLNSVEFQMVGGLAVGDFRPTNVVYIKGANAFAANTILDKPVKNRMDKNLLALALRQHLERCLLSIKERLENSVYDASLGADCVKYAASSTLGRIPTDNGEMRIDAIQGYLCLHPNLDNFGVFMQTSTFATVWTDIPKKENQSSFFQSLRFLPISSSVSRNFTKRRTPREHT